jgi:predicted PurR-regulated permease PerM
MVMGNDKNQWIELAARIVVLALLVIGCFVVLMPFLAAVMWAGIVCFSTWPFYAWLERHMPGKRRQAKAALLMILIISLILVVPFAAMGVTVADNMERVVAMVSGALKGGLPPPPEWVARIPLFGRDLSASWHVWAADPSQMGAVAMKIANNSREWILTHSLNAVTAMAKGIAQLCLSVLVMFFIYRHGDVIAAYTRNSMRKLAGARTQYFMDVIGGTVRGVVYGLLGTAIVQGILAAIGFWVAGVPSALFLGLLTFFFALVPFGPPLIWGPVSAWLIWGADRPMAGVCLALWGLLVVSGVDNVLRPYIISRGNNMPFILVFLGVLGGLMAFGFIGIFLGPALLTIGYGLLEVWTSPDKGAAAAPENQ